MPGLIYAEQYKLAKEIYMTRKPPPSLVKVAAEVGLKYETLRQYAQRHKWQQQRDGWRADLVDAKLPVALEHIPQKKPPMIIPTPEELEQVAIACDVPRKAVELVFDYFQQLAARCQLATLYQVHGVIERELGQEDLTPGKIKDLATALDKVIHLERMILQLPSRQSQPPAKEFHQHVHTGTEFHGHAAQTEADRVELERLRKIEERSRKASAAPLTHTETEQELGKSKAICKKKMDWVNDLVEQGEAHAEALGGGDAEEEETETPSSPE